MLRTQELGETDRILTLLAERHGKVRGVARSARKSRRRFGGLMEPMTHVRATWLEKEGRELHRIEALEGLRSFASMQAEPLLQAVCAVLSELSEVFSREGQAEPKTFKLLGAVLDALERGADPWSVLRYFEYWLLRLHGLLPDLSSCSGCSTGLPANGTPRVVARAGVLCPDCQSASGRTALPLTAADREFIDTARQRPPVDLTRARNEARPGGALEALLRGALESFAEKPFRTYRHLETAAESSGGSGQS